MSKPVTIQLTTSDYLCTATDGSHSWQIDEPPEKGGGGLAPDPLALLLGSLGSCTAITIRMYAKRKGWAVEEVVVKTDLLQRVVLTEKETFFTRDIRIRGHLDEAQILRLHQIANACPVSKILEGKVLIETEIKQFSDAD